MGVFKEEARAFETIAQNSFRIYNDSCDYGYLYNTENPDANIQQVIDSVKRLKKLDDAYGTGDKFVRDRVSWTRGVMITIRIAWEIDEGYYRGTEYTISFNKVNPKHPSFILKNSDANAFISVEVEPYMEKA